MALSRILPDFGTTQPAHTAALNEVALEDQKLDSYEAGYQAGWDDSAAANTDAGNQVAADFAQNMRDLSMTYHEAYAALLADIKPLLTQIVDTVLPAMAQDTLGPRVLELIEAQMTTGPRSALVLSTAPDGLKMLEPMVEGLDENMVVELRADETLAAGQVHLSFGTDHEEELDTAALIDGIQAAVHGFFQTQTDSAPQTELTKETA
ncbi:MAG: ABC transporter ATP-binding protein [Pseudomonadota bacterium]